MNRRIAIGIAALLAIPLVAGGIVLASDAQMYFSSDKNGQNRVTDIQEGDEIWIVVIDNDENADCDVRDKMSPDLKILDPKTGAYIVWDADADFDAMNIGDEDYLEETGADTGVFVSKRAFQVGTRYRYEHAQKHYATHVVDVPDVNGDTDDFQWGHYMYVPINNPGVQAYADDRGWAGGVPSWGTDPNWNPGRMDHTVVVDAVGPNGVALTQNEYLIGRFENMDTLIGMYQDPNDATDVAIAMMKIIDVEATIAWDMEIYNDANGAATITVVDPDENLNCNEVEYVPVFIIVNPGSWNPVDGNPQTGEGGRSPTNFCMLKRTGGVVGDTKDDADIGEEPIRWYNIYNADANAIWDIGGQGAVDGRYYIEYPALGDDNVNNFDTTHLGGITPVSFYAQETGTDTGVFQLNLNSILDDLGFNSLRVRDVLVAYYLDPNDFDDFKIATAYIEERQHSITSFTDANRAEVDLYWIGRDPVYVQVIDANANTDPCCPEQVVVHICDPHGEDDSEWIILDETSSNSPVFFTFSGYQLWPVWDALGVGLVEGMGGFQLQLDNWKLEVFNEDDVYARYNDVYYGVPRNNPFPFYNDVRWGLLGLGDLNIHTSFPPWISNYFGPYRELAAPKAIEPGARVANDVSFDLMSIADTQVFDGTTTQMYWLDRNGNRVSSYVNSDCVFIEVVDPDQDEDPYRRERIDGYWDGGQNVPFGPQALREFECELDPRGEHPVNLLLGDTNIFNDTPAEAPNTVFHGEPKLYVLNPRSGFWAAVDLLETGVATGDFVSVICIDLVHVYECVPTLDVVPGDTIVAFYQDPSNHSDNAMVSIKVGIGGGGTPPTQASTTMFVDADGNDVANYTDIDMVYVKVIDPSHVGAPLLANAVEIDGETYDLTLWYDAQTFAPEGVFLTEAIDLDLAPGETLTATYSDPTDPADTSSDTITVIASVLVVESFYASPNPFEIDCTFGYVGSGVASAMSVDIYDLAGTLIWSSEQPDVNEIVWDGTAGAPCRPVANGAYIYVIRATDGTNTFVGKGKVFVNR